MGYPTELFLYSPAVVRYDLLIIMIALSGFNRAMQDEGVGGIDIPYLFGDGGIVAMQAGAVVPVTWVDAPPNALLYVFVWKSLRGDNAHFIMGFDGNSDQEISTQWKVRERLTGVAYGVAFYADGTRVLSRISDLEYASGEAPPEGICSANNIGMSGSPEVFSNPPGEEADMIILGYMRTYTPVLERIIDSDGFPWLKIDLTVPDVLSPLNDDVQIPEAGWIYAPFVDLFGDCSFLD